MEINVQQICWKRKGKDFFLNSKPDTLDALENSDKKCTNTVSRSQNARWIECNYTKERMTNRWDTSILSHKLHNIFSKMEFSELYMQISVHWDVRNYSENWQVMSFAYVNIFFLISCSVLLLLFQPDFLFCFCENYVKFKPS